jgi:preprotein translocase subunit SecY
LLNAFQNITKVPELKKRLVVTAMLLTVYRIGVYIPTPGIDTQSLTALFAAQSGTLFGLIDMFSGGAVSRFSIFTLGIRKKGSSAGERSPSTRDTGRSSCR